MAKPVAWRWKSRINCNWCHAVSGLQLADGLPVFVAAIRPAAHLAKAFPRVQPPLEGQPIIQPRRDAIPIKARLRRSARSRRFVADRRQMGQAERAFKQVCEVEGAAIADAAIGDIMRRRSAVAGCWRAGSLAAPSCMLRYRRWSPAAPRPARRTFHHPARPSSPDRSVPLSSRGGSMTSEVELQPACGLQQVAHRAGAGQFSESRGESVRQHVAPSSSPALRRANATND